MPISVWILGDQLLANHPALAAAEAETNRANLRVVLVQSQARIRKLRYQRKKLVLLFSAMRHYAQELGQQGYHVEYVTAPTFTSALQEHAASHNPAQLFTMAAADWHGRAFQQSLAERLNLPVTVLPNTQFLTGRHNPYPYADVADDQRVVQEYFYRAMRRHFGILLEGNDPVGGKWNYDTQNRQPLPAGNRPPAAPGFAPDAITQEVMAQVSTMPGLGTVDGFNLAVTRQQALSAFGNFVAHRLHDFGPYEDAMTQRHDTLYHSVLSPYLNIGLLEPLELVRTAERAYHDGRAPINSVEGFVRQILGWREFMVWQYWRLGPEMKQMNTWGAERPLPNFFWTGETDMNCLRHAISRALDNGYTHHIERLMLLCNFAILAGLNPAEVNDWFQAAYVDAYEWVMLPNVIGMGLNADGGLIATKPYIASANYIHKMSDYCETCPFNHKQRHGEDACPFNTLYWHFLLQHEETLRRNPRLGKNVLGLRHLDAEERRLVRQQAAALLRDLSAQSRSSSGK